MITSTHSRFARFAFASVALFAASVLAAPAGPGSALKYPDAKRVDQVDDYHGTKVADPYRWLEDDVRKSKDVENWVTEENKVTFGYLNSIPERDGIKKRLTELWNYEKFQPPFKIGGRYYISKNSGLQNQFVMYMMK